MCEGVLATLLAGMKGHAVSADGNAMLCLQVSRMNRVSKQDEQGCSVSADMQGHALSADVHVRASLQECSVLPVCSPQKGFIRSLSPGSFGFAQLLALFGQQTYVLLLLFMRTTVPGLGLTVTYYCFIIIKLHLQSIPRGQILRF